MRLKQISHLLKDLGIPAVSHMLSHSQSLVASMKNRIYRGTTVAHIATKYYLAADMARDGEIDLSYVLTGEMLANCFTKQLPKPAFLKECAAVQMFGIGLGYALGIGIMKGLGNGLGMLGNGHESSIGIGT
jgi:hypothetical protein